MSIAKRKDDSAPITPRPTAGAAPRRKRGTITKEAIMEVASAMFKERGYDRTSLDEIAAALSVTKPSLYYYFRNKEDILLECIKAGYAHFADNLLAADDERRSGRERVQIFLDVYLSVVKDRVLSMIVADDRMMSESGRALYSEYRRIINAHLKDRIKAGIADGSIRATDARLVTFAIFGMFNWITRWTQPPSDDDIADVRRAFSGVIFDGISAPS